MVLFFGSYKVFMQKIQEQFVRRWQEEGQRIARCVFYNSGCFLGRILCEFFILFKWGYTFGERLRVREQVFIQDQDFSQITERFFLIVILLGFRMVIKGQSWRFCFRRVFRGVRIQRGIEIGILEDIVVFDGRAIVGMIQFDFIRVIRNFGRYLFQFCFFSVLGLVFNSNS